MKLLDKVKVVKSVDCLPEIDIGHTGIIVDICEWRTGIIFDICEGCLDDKLQTCYGVSFFSGYQFYFKKSELKVIKE